VSKASRRARRNRQADNAARAAADAITADAIVLHPAAPWLRIAAMIYEAVLLFGVAFAGGLIAMALTGGANPPDEGRRIVLQAVLFLLIGAYFVWCWTRFGQTLALRTWKLALVDERGRPPSLRRAVARYLLSWHLFVPGLLYIALVSPSRYVALAALTVGFAFLLLPLWMDPQRRLLHDRLTRTFVVRAPGTAPLRPPGGTDPDRARTAAR